MGGGTFSYDTYTSTKTHRAATKIPDFARSSYAAGVDASLKAKRINNKASGLSKLESRDSVEHPESNAFIVFFDVTGSNKQRAVDAQAKLPNLMTLLEKYISDPQLAVGANDDYTFVGDDCIQISEFESDNRIDDSIRNICLIGFGGGNDGESYDLALYCIARKTVTDCYEQRGKKGYFFMYADEPIFTEVKASEVKAVFGDTIQANIPIGDIIDEVKERYNVFVIWPDGGYDHARKQYVELFGEDSVVTLQHPNMICELIGSIVGMNEEKTDAASAVTDLVAVGVDSSTATALVHTSLSTLANAKGVAKASGTLPVVGKGKASRL